MTEDPRCCGTGTCIIDDAGRCWCGQQWDGEKMCHPAQVLAELPTAVPHQVPGQPAPAAQPAPASDSTRYK